MSNIEKTSIILDNDVVAKILSDENGSLYASIHEDYNMFDGFKQGQWIRIKKLSPSHIEIYEYTPTDLEKQAFLKLGISI